MADLFERAVEAREGANPDGIARCLNNKCTVCRADAAGVMRFFPERWDLFSPYVRKEEDEDVILWFALCERCRAAPQDHIHSTVKLLMVRRKDQILN